MPHYQFILLNEQKIRQHFKEWENCKEKKPDDHNYENRLYVIGALQSGTDIKKLCDDPIFCQCLARSLFPIAIIEVFGGYEKLLSLPSVSLDGYYQSKYISLEHKFMPKDIDVVLTLDNHTRPVIAFRLVEKDGNPENNYLICYHSRYAYESDGCIQFRWVVGEQSTLLKEGIVCRSNSRYSVATISKLKMHSRLSDFTKDQDLTASDFELFINIVRGNPIKDDVFNAQRKSFYCPFTEKQKLVLDKAATRIQAAFRRHSTLSAYKRYKQTNNEISEVSEAATKLLRQGKVLEGTTLLGEIPQLTSRLREIGTKLKLC